MAGPVRVWTDFPGYERIAEIESVNILDTAPPAVTPGAGTGVVLIVGEFERGPLNTPKTVTGASDLLTTFGSLGFAVNGNPYAGAVAVRSGGNELWNGNGYIWLNRKRFRNPVICRVDNSAGLVTFTRNAALLGDIGPYVAANNDTVIFTRNGTTTLTATITGTAGTLTGDGFPGDASQVWQVDVSGAPDFVDETTDFNDVGAADLTPFPAVEATGDYFAIGRAYTTFSQVIFDYAGGTAGTGGTVAWEYWNGSAWTALAGVTDATAGFTTAVADGLTVSWTVPTDWARTSLNGAWGYYVRARCTGVYATNPILDQGYIQANNVSGFVGGEYIELRTRNGGASRVVEFRAADQTQAQVAARINAVLGLTTATVVGTQLVLSGEVSGGGGYIEIVGGDAVATLGFPTAAIQQRREWVVTNTSAGDYDVPVRRNLNGVLTDYTASVTATGAETDEELRDLIYDEFADLAVPGATFSTSGTDTIVMLADANILFTFPALTEPTGGDLDPDTTIEGVSLIGYGLGNVQDLETITRAEAITIFDALSGVGSDANPDGLLRVSNTGTPTTGTLQVTGGTAYAAFGFDLTTVADAGDADDVTIPAGTRVQDSTATATIWVTLVDVETGTGGGPWTARVRPFTDDDTAQASTTGNVTSILSSLPDAFTVTNAATLTRLSSNQLDVRYEEALAATLDENSEARRANFVASARTSLRIMAALKENARAATAAGLSARKYFVRPPIGTTVTAARASTGIGVGNTAHSRTDRGVYCFPSVAAYVPEIAAVGATVGGRGFTDTGIIQVGWDSYVASLASQFRPEQNIGVSLANRQQGPLAVLAFEDLFNSETTGYGGIPLNTDTYILLKASGICAPRNDVDKGFHVQSDVTCVDATTQRALAPANRRRFADFCIDTMAAIGKEYEKELAGLALISAMNTSVTSVFDQILSRGDPSAQRIANYSFVLGGNAQTDALGIGVWSLKVQMLKTLESILYNIQVGQGVLIEAA
jgi:hypothetical protein